MHASTPLGLRGCDMLELSKIRIDGGTQSRVALNQEVVDEYAEGYRAGANMPPIVVFFDGSEFWLADGFHRFFAAKQAGCSFIHEERTPGQRRDAVLYSLGANSKHGLRRCNADKRQAVETLLADPEWAAWSDNEIAKRCGVGNHLVADVKKSLTLFSPSEEPAERTYTTKHGTKATMNTANIGKVVAAPIQPASAPAPAEQAARSPTAEPAVPQPTEQARPTELENLREQVNEVAQNLKATLEDNESMARVFDADDKIAAAVAEATRYREQNRILEARITGLLNEKNEAIRHAKSWKRRAEKAEAELARGVS